MTAAVKGWMRWKCLTDLYYLSTEVLGLKHAKDRKGRKRLDPKLHRKMCRELESEEDSMHLYFRGAMKTTLMQDAIIQKLLQYPYCRIGYFAKTSGLVEANLKEIKAKLQNETLMELFPDLIPDRKQWERDTRNQLTLIRNEDGRTAPKEHQIECWGVGASVAGRHYDFHFYDDIIDEKSVTTGDQIEKIRVWWDMMQAIKDPAAYEKVIGTFYHYRDIYNVMKGTDGEEGFFPVCTIMPAMVGDRIQYSYYTQKHLQRLKKRMTPYSWSCQYMLDPHPREDKMFIGPYKKWRIGDEVKIELPEDAEYYITVDPALGRRYSDKTGMCIACISKSNPGLLFFVECLGLNERPEKVAKLLVQKIVKYRPRTVGIEYGLQESLQFRITDYINEWQEENQQKLVTEFLPLSTGKEKKADKINRTIGVLVRDDRCAFTSDMTAMFHQMDYYNPNSDKNDDDILDAGAMMVMTVPYFSQSRWWNVERPKSIGYTIENLFKKKQKNTWESSFAS